MPKLDWDPKTKAAEWSKAKKELTDSNGHLQNGKKLRRKSSGLSHSFLVIDNQILALNGQGMYLGAGSDGRVKLAENESGDVFALKIGGISEGEAKIASDLGVAGKMVTSTQEGVTKGYLAYKYLGVPLSNYLKKFRKESTINDCYDLSIKILLALHALHSGSTSRTQTPCIHRDLHQNNMVVDADNNVHIIDFGVSIFTNKLSQKDQLSDSVHLRTALYTKRTNLCFDTLLRRNELGVFNKHIIDYYCCGSFQGGDLKFMKSQIRVELLPEGNTPTDIQYSVYDPASSTQLHDLPDGYYGHIGTIPLSQFCFKSDVVENMIDELQSNSELHYQFLSKVIENGHMPDIFKDINPSLFKILNGPALSNLELAEKLTVCRFNLSDHHASMISQLPAKDRVDVIQWLNSQSETQKVVTNFFSFNDYVNAELKKINVLEMPAARVVCYETLQEYIKRTISDLMWNQSDNSSDSASFEESNAFIYQITQRVEKEQPAMRVILKLDELTTAFTNKIKDLEDRSKLLNVREKERYLPAIADAHVLMNQLKCFRKEFEIGLDFLKFKEKSVALLKEYENKDSFKTNRSQSWFRTCIFEPFEQLKAFIKQISVYLLGYQGTFFNPSETNTTTNTTRKLIEFRQGVENEVVISPPKK